MSLVHPLFEGPIDIIGDIHGEYDALLNLLDQLGYDDQGYHPEGRRLVFVGDYCDRGPDSPAVIKHIHYLVDTARAQAILGNHELYYLCNKTHEGTGWYQPTRFDSDVLKYGPFTTVQENDKALFHDFFSSLPLALERDDLRIVHAAWDLKAIEAARLLTYDTFLEQFEEWDNEIHAMLESSGIKEHYQQEQALWQTRLSQRDCHIPFLTYTAQYRVLQRTLNPIRVLTLGLERQAKAPFFSGGQWWFSERVRWWDHYYEDIPVIIGHHWRRLISLSQAAIGNHDPGLFEGIDPLAWHGVKRNVYCIDYSVAGRWQERKNGPLVGHIFKLAAMRWPEKKVFFDEP